MFYYELDRKEDAKEISPKGGLDLKGDIFKVVRINKTNDYAFFGKELDKIFIFKIEIETFEKLIIRFVTPQPRINYTITALKDDRIILIGGMNDNKCLDDIHFFIPFNYCKERHYTTSRLDVFGSIEKGYNGHAAIVLPNSHILISGGCNYVLDPLRSEKEKKQKYKDTTLMSSETLIEIPKRLKLLNIFKSYRWELPIGKDIFISI